MSNETNISRGSVAEDFAQQTQEISIAEFFEKNKQMLGFDSKSRAIVTAVKEGVDNALDATEEAGFLPTIRVTISEEGDYYKIVLEDNGPGITESEIPKIFGKLLYGSRFAKRSQTRGQQGIGISAAVLYAQNTTGHSAKVKSKPENYDQAFELDVRIDTETNEPIVENKTQTNWDEVEHGTRIELVMDANMRGRKQLHRYIKDTALANPHASLYLTEPEFTFESERVTSELPPETEEILPHPHGIEVGILREMILDTEQDTLNQFLQNDFCKVGQKTSKRIRDRFKDYEYGKPLSWDVESIFTQVNQRQSEETDDTTEEETCSDKLREQIVDEIYGKSPESKQQLAEKIVETVLSRDSVTYYDVAEIVHESAIDVQETQDERIGSTVQESVRDATWQFIRDHRTVQLVELVDAATSDRKSKETISVLAHRLSDLLDEYEIDTLTLDELDDVIEDASDYAADETDTAVGDTARSKITTAITDIAEIHPDTAPSLDELRKTRRGSSTLKNLQSAMRETKVNAPSTKCLSPITEERIEDGLRNLFDADFFTSTQRDGEVYKGSPFIVEVGIAYGNAIGSADEQIDLRRFANRVPLVYKQGACSITSVTENIDWRNYNLSQSGGTGTLPRGNMALMVHIASTNVPFNSKSKDSVAGPEVIENEIERAIRSSARDLKKYLNKQKSLRQKKRKRDTIGDVLPPMAESLAKVSGRDVPDTSTTVSRIMGTVLFTEGDSKDAVTVTNFSPTTESFTVQYDTDSTDEITLSSQETTEISGTEITITDIEDAKVTVSEAVANAITYIS